MRTMTRRGFLQTAIVGIAAASISLRLSRGPVYLAEEQKYTWESPNDDYSYGINKKQPWDVLIMDERAGEFITPDELRDRGKLEFVGNPNWPAPELRGDEPLAPVKLQGDPVEVMEAPFNNYDDKIDRAFLAYAAVVVSQGYIGWSDAGKPGFSAPMKFIEEDVDARIYTTSREYYADQQLA